MDNILLFTDGACSGNPGPGGYCAILQYMGHEKIICGAEKQTTNNRMELTAVIEGLSSLKRSCNVKIYSDSTYVCNAINNRWLKSWKAKNWRKSDGKPVLNVELWQKLDKLLETHNVEFIWIKGHAGHPENERCDKLAVAEYMKLIN